jgi:tetratricopeptide (TPR) repeat protein
MAADPSAGDALLAALSFAGAVDAYTAALDKTSDDASAADLLCRRSAAHAALGTKASFEAAAADGLAAVTRNPAFHLGYFRAGVALRSLCRFSDAEKLLSEGLSRAPDPTLFQEAIEELAKIRAVETEAGLEPAVAAREADRFRELEEWLLHGGGSTFPALYMRRYEDSASNRGVHARVDIPPDTEVMAIGREFLITVEMGQACPIGRKIAAAGRLDLSAAKHCYLAVFVLWDRLNEASFFQPYYRILPETYPNMPIFWTPEEVGWKTVGACHAALSATPPSFAAQVSRGVLHAHPDRGPQAGRRVDDGTLVAFFFRAPAIHATLQHIFQDYETLCCVAPELREIADLEAFSWARMMVCRQARRI